jgi:hypothetical protein
MCRYSFVDKDDDYYVAMADRIERYNHDTITFNLTLCFGTFHSSNTRDA